MDHGAFEILNAWDLGIETLSVVVVASAQEDEASVELLLLGAVHCDIELPMLIFGRPVHGLNLVVELDVAVDAMSGGGRLDIFQDGGSIGNGSIFLPRVPRETKSMKVRIRSDAGIFEQTPCTAYFCTTLEDGVRVVGYSFLEAVSRVDTRDSSADDEDIEIIVAGNHGVFRRVASGGFGWVCGDEKESLAGGRQNFLRRR